MAIDDGLLPPAVAQVETGLNTLLSIANGSPTPAGVHDALNVEVLSDSVVPLVTLLNDPVVEPQAPGLLETAARKIFYSIVDHIDVDSAGSYRIWNLLDVLLLLSELRQTGRAIVWYLVEELVESQTADRCRLVFDYLDARRDRLTQREFQVTHLIILRTCNELLRRLSRAEDATFCGRVFFFLFQTFPLGEQSSVNLRGEFHTDNVTVFDEGSVADPRDPESMVVDEAPKQPSQKPKAPSTTAADDASFYTTFWNLQRDFSTPTRLIEDEVHFTSFKAGLESTIARFGKTSVVKTKSTAEETRGVKRKRGQAEGGDYQGNYNPKYLTSRELFDLELSDLSFQRHILVQALILLDFLLSLSDAAQKKLDGSGIPRLNSSVNYGYTLPEDKREWVQSARAKIATYLQQGPDGSFYYRMVNTVLARDKNWIWWKIQRCPPIVKDAIPADDYITSRDRVRTATTSRRTRARPMGAMDLTFLSEADNTKGLDTLRDPARFRQPGIEEMVAELGREELDLDFATGQEKEDIRGRMDGIEWRIVRAASRTELARLGRLGGKRTVAQVFAVDGGGGSVAVSGDGGDEAGGLGEGRTPEVLVA